MRFSEMSEVPAVSTAGVGHRRPGDPLSGAVAALLSSDDPVLVKGAARAAGRVRWRRRCRSLGGDPDAP
jgi:hypothetical protein